MVVIRATADVFRFVIDDLRADRLNQRLLFFFFYTKNEEYGNVVNWFYRTVDDRL